MKNKVLRAMVVAIAGSTVFSWPMAISAGAMQRIPFAGTLTATTRLILPVIPDGTPNPPPNPEYWSNSDYVARCQGAPVVDAGGAGNVSILGAVFDVQSHCIGAPAQQSDGIPFFGGVFTLKDSQGRSLSGQYKGRLLPTTNSHTPTAPNDPPGGPWLIEGNLCFSGGSQLGKVVDDCAAQNYSPVTGITNLSNGDASIFINQTVGIRNR